MVDIMIVGVGGQGILTSSQVIGRAALKKGLDVFMSEVHGMAQRGGVVVTTVKIGEKIYSPLVGKGDADVILGFEPVETYRTMDKASRDTWVITNTEPIIPFTVSTGKDTYPDVGDVFKSIGDSTNRFVAVDAGELAREAGAAITQNIVMVGALTGTGVLPMSKEEVLEAVRVSVPERFRDMNEKAFNIGFDVVSREINSHG